MVRLRTPRPLPIDKYDGTYDEHTWNIAEAITEVLLEEAHHCIFGRQHKVQKTDLLLHENRHAQLQLGQQLAKVAATAECYVCLKAGTPQREIKNYIGKRQPF